MAGFVYHKGKEQKSDKDYLFNEARYEKRPKERLNILLLGSGGRECAMAWKLSSSVILEKLFIAPGNGGTEFYGINVPDLAITNFAEVEEFVKNNDIDLILVGPEEPLVKGIVDYFAEKLPHIPVIGPSKACARMEGSKEFSKAFMKKYRIPTARYHAFAPEELPQAEAFLKTLLPPYVLKADGLAAGKGVLIVDNLEEAHEGLEKLFDGATEDDTKHVVIEEYLKGIECSVFVATDGTNYMVLPTVKDYKRIGDGDTGPNTGGMGAISPVSFADEPFMEKVRTQIIEPTLSGLQQEGTPYTGFLFIGLMNVNGNPFVIEYNCRLGDPETQALMPRIASDFGEMLQAIAQKKLSEYKFEQDPRYVAAVVHVSRGYPASYVKGYEITLPQPPEDTILFHAGTTILDGKLVTSGGRVLAVASYGSSLQVALERSYATSQQVLFEGKNYRHDIGNDLLHLE